MTEKNIKIPFFPDLKSFIFNFQFSIFNLYAFLVLIAVGIPAWYLKGWKGALAAGIAVTLCWLGAIISINFARYALKNALIGIMMGMFFRMGIPLAGGLVAILTAEKEFGTLLLLLILFAYLLLLPVDVALILLKKSATDDDPAASS